MKVVLKFFWLCYLFFNFTSVYADLAGSNPSTIAAPQDAFAGATNPASAVLVVERLDTSVRWLQYRQHIDVFDNQIEGVNGRYNASRSKNFYFPEFAYNKPFKLNLFNHPIESAFSLVAYTPLFVKTTYDQPFPIMGTSRMGYEYLVENIYAVLAAKINKKHSVGIALVDQVARQKVNGLELSDLPSATIAPGYVTNKGYDYESGVGVNLGWLWQINDKLTFGAVYRSKILVSKFRKYKGYLPALGGTDFPQQLGAGIAYVLTSRLGLTFDAFWYNWSNTQAGYPARFNPRLLGTTKGPGFGIKNQFFYIVGAGYQLSDMLALKGGYAYTNAIFPNYETLANTLTCITVKNYLFFNPTFYLGKKNEISIYYQHGFNQGIRGTSNSIPSTSGGGRVDLYQASDALSIGWGYKF